MRSIRHAQYVALDGQFLVAEILDKRDRSITAHLFRNPKDYRADAAMERHVELRLTRPQPYHRGCCSFDRQGSS